MYQFWTGGFDYYENFLQLLNILFSSIKLNTFVNY